MVILKTVDPETTFQRLVNSILHKFLRGELDRGDRQVLYRVAQGRAENGRKATALARVEVRMLYLTESDE